jgi:hypothetical protein
VYQRDNLTQHDQVIASRVRSPQPTVERRRRVDQDRAAGYAWFEGHAVEHRRADRALPVSEPACQIMLSCGEHIDGERPGTLDQAETAAGLLEADQHQVVAGLFAGIVPMIPFEPGWPIDFVPVDVVADAIACVVENRVSEGEFWISAGEAALRLTPPAILDAADLDWLARALTSAARHVSRIMAAAA